MNNPALSVALATAPSSAFDELRERPKFWFPLLLQVIAAVAISYWYYSVVDVEWFKDLMITHDPELQKLSNEERAQMMSMLGRNTLLAGALVGGLFFVPALLLAISLYLLLAAKVTGLPQGFKHWFALSSWSSLPLLLGSVVSAIFLFLSDNTQISPSVMQPLSINELVLQRPMGSPGYALFESLTIPLMLSLLLMIIGVRAWSGRSWAFSAVLVLLPVVVLYGVWAAIAFG